MKKNINVYSVVRGLSLSCGCFREVMLKKKCKKTLNKIPRIYTIWREMKNRCYNPRRKDYKYYGLRNIGMCDEWLNNYNCFQDWALNNGYASDLTIDRKDVNKGYYPENCTWITMKEQNNNKRNVLKIEFQGMTKNLKEWSEYFGINYGTMKDRYKKYKDISKCIYKEEKKL